MGKEVWHAGYRMTIVENRIGSWRGRLSVPPSLSLQGDMGMGKPHSILAMYVSAEKQIGDHDWYQRRNRQDQHVVNFKTSEISYLPCSRQRMRTHNESPFIHHAVKTHNELPFSRQRVKSRHLGYKKIQIPKWCHAENPEIKEKLILWMN